jgi:hypothetical protein
MQPGFLLNKEGKNIQDIVGKAAEIKVSAKGTLKLCRFGQHCWRPNCHFGHEDECSRASRWAKEWRGQVCEIPDPAVPVARQGREMDDPRSIKLQTQIDERFLVLEELVAKLTCSGTDISENVEELDSHAAGVERLCALEQLVVKVQGQISEVSDFGLAYHAQVEEMRETLGDVSDLGYNMRDICNDFADNQVKIAAKFGEIDKKMQMLEEFEAVYMNDTYLCTNSQHDVGHVSIRSPPPGTSEKRGNVAVKSPALATRIEFDKHLQGGVGLQVLTRKNY